MSRDILFRGKNINNEWREGNLSILKKDLNLTPKVPKGYYISNTAGAPFAFTIRPETVGQYTGLKDKNGKKIFEGDIVIVTNKPYDSKKPIIVTWGSKSHGWSLKFNCGNVYNHKPLYKYYSLPASKNIEVIGNIHDNPELLKQ